MRKQKIKVSQEILSTKIGVSINVSTVTKLSTSLERNTITAKLINLKHLLVLGNTQPHFTSPLMRVLC